MYLAEIYTHLVLLCDRGSGLYHCNQQRGASAIIWATSRLRPILITWRGRTPTARMHAILGIELGSLHHAPGNRRWVNTWLRKSSRALLIVFPRGSWSRRMRF